jgi:hypothetical protein
MLKVFTNLALTIPGSGIRVGMSGIFTFFPAILCGPIWGGLASGLSDLLGYLFAPDGAYIPWLTLTAFLGGVLKGLVWKLLDIKASVRTRALLAALFLIVGVFGGVTTAALASDGVIDSLVAVQSELPTKAEIEKMELSPLSDMAVGLTQYNKDTLTMTAAGGENVILPSSLTLDGCEVSLSSKLNDGVLEGCVGTLTIPNNYKTIAAGVFGEADTSGVTIICTEGSAAHDFAKKNSISFTLVEKIEKHALALSSESFEGGGVKFKSGDNYRKYLASNINLVGCGLLIAGALGLLIMLISIVYPYISALFKKKKKTDEGERSGTSFRSVAYVRIAACGTISGLVVTTINTFILMEVLAAYAGRAFWVLYVPRVAEELMVCLVQAFVISLLYGIIARGRVKEYLDKL